MRIFIQKSVAGFKIFDVGAFLHNQESLTYATMSEIASTHSGENNLRTHIIGNDSHGMRLETMRLFSSNAINLLLHEDYIEGVKCRCLFASHVGESKDELNRTCEISFCIMSETANDIDVINRLGYALLVMKDTSIAGNIEKLLDKVIIGDQLVLAFNNKLWEETCSILNNLQTTESPELFDEIINRNSQVVVLNGDLLISKVHHNNNGLFNKNPYYCYKSITLPLKQVVLSAPIKPIHVHHELLGDKSLKLKHCLDKIKKIIKEN